jgi:hypothetical protein
MRIVSFLSLGGTRIMSRTATHVNYFPRIAIGLACLALAGCQPEGTGSVKAPGPRGDDTNLGRPFGNAPELPKKAAPAPTKNQVAQPANPRL